jgi:G3E family GTPase
LKVPVQIVSGFLGAGKTTAIRARLGALSGLRVAIIVNDFGEAALDEAALEETEPFRLTNIPGGCVCCTAPEGFVDALGAVLAERPDRLIVEPTGLARPQDLIDTIRRCAHRDALELAPTLVLVDPARLSALAADPEERHLLHEQAQGADVLVANRADLCGEDALARFRELADALWPPPLATFVTSHGALPPELWEWPAGEGPRAARASTGAHAHPHDSTAGYHARSWKWAPEVIFSRERLTRGLQRLAADTGSGLARFKGIFRTQEGVSRFEVAGGVLHDRLTSFRRDSRADAIARGDAAALGAIEALLGAVILGASELAIDATRIEVVVPGGAVHGVDRARLIALPDGIADVSARFPKRAGAAARVAALFDALGVGDRGVAVVVAGDGFAAEPVAVSVLREGVLVHTLDGQPLPEKQGGPFRLLIPDDASPEPVSCANVKGVAKIVVRERQAGG